MTVWDEIAAIPRLDRKTEADLGRRIAGGSSRAVTRLAEANLWVAIPIAKAMCRKSGGKWEAGDMLSEASIALTACAERWDYKSPVRFGAYARMRVRGAMKDFLRKKADVVRGTGQQPVSLDAYDRDSDPQGFQDFQNGARGDDEPEEWNMGKRMSADDTESLDDDPFQALTPRERQIVERRIIKTVPDSVATVANDLNVTEAYVRRVQGSAFQKLGKLAA